MAPRASRAVIVRAVLVTTASAVMLGRLWLAGSTVSAAGPTASLDGATVDVRGAAWATMDHLEDGFQMPAQMMPGAPNDDEVRLGVNVTLVNTRSGSYEFSLVDEFTMTGGLEAEPLRLTADTVGPLGRLGPGSALNAILYFDVKAPDGDDGFPPLYLNWTRGRDTILIQVPMPGGEVPAHGDH